jgi:hypothetical protein
MPEEKDHIPDHINELLDASLAAFGKVEPREGLELRVLANLSQREVAPARAWFSWKWAVPVAVAAMIVAAVIVRKSVPLPAAPNVTARVSVAPEVPAVPSIIATAHTPAHGKHQVRISVHTVAEPALVKPGLVKKEGFFAASALSEQELLLRQYLHKTPKQEVELQTALLQPSDPLLLNGVQPQEVNQGPAVVNTK